ncbi:uncharacterized protein F5147DRAFT_726871 [Suillus discolor]|uniref:Mediator complex subunit 20 n=1 Tax=Suillus discolor TaxID=1912936 RepID=A0A9P7JM42_9AGAM|nr:uncharacterized protein F5147DRAFT_726871 [Suillus discolor]KAG1833169.1 hypothetical protein EV424DRAFT_1367406 [Suillus variegatus]KAG1872636.1 hypothetical protein C8R48DRAFT_695125 [Suillus tomentosus]KAG2056398.1 hypothetical protein BDR06DRAFT_981443 [Suillus hirtellus]KAG2088487.1 hypothetical protein F5147DRAFT_726871 [Suillus discolor]
MGFTGLARWINAPSTGLELIRENIMRNHHGQLRGRWFLSVKSYRSTLGSIPGLQVHSERSMCTLTMNENVFVLLEDPAAPTRADIVTSVQNSQTTDGQVFPVPPHYRTTFLTLRPPGALEQVLHQLRARWIPVRQTAPGAQRSQGGQQLSVEGFVFAIGNDWLVRVGHVVLAGGAVKGMLLEAEYLPLPVLHSQTADGTSELLSNLLTSVLPNIREAKTVAVTISDSQWEEVLWDREEEERQLSQEKAEPEGDPDNIYVFGDEGLTSEKKGDWIGVDRDRRSAFLIIGALKSEGIL